MYAFVSMLFSKMIQCLFIIILQLPMTCQGRWKLKPELMVYFLVFKIDCCTSHWLPFIDISAS